MASCTKNVYKFLRLRCFKEVKIASEKTVSELVNQQCPEFFLDCNSVSCLKVASSFVGSKSIKHPASEVPSSVCYRDVGVEEHIWDKQRVWCFPIR